MRKITPVSYRTLTRVFQADGFRFVAQKGDHLIFTKPGIARPLVIPKHDRIPIFVIKNTLRTARMSRERHFQLLEIA